MIFVDGNHISGENQKDLISGSTIHGDVIGFDQFAGLIVIKGWVFAAQLIDQIADWEACRFGVGHFRVPGLCCLRHDVNSTYNIGIDQVSRRRFSGKLDKNTQIFP